MTQQPVWKFLKNLGDVNPLDHGGLFVFEDETGTYPAELERVEPVSEEDRVDLEIRRVTLDRCTHIDGIVSDNRFLPSHPAWFADSLKQVASMIGSTEADLIQQLCSEDAIERAFAYRAIFDYHGWDNGDAYPMTLSYALAKGRYVKILKEGT